MSHPSETSLTSRELAEQIEHLRSLYNEPFTHIVALIDAWVRVREAEAQVSSVTKILRMADVGCTGYHPTGCRHCESHDYRRELESALATASKQLQEKVK